MKSLSELEKGLLGFRSGCFLRGGVGRCTGLQMFHGDIMLCHVTLRCILYSAIQNNTVQSIKYVV